jgi:hypothetical protein
MTAEERVLAIQKLTRLTIPGASEFWGEICEYLDGLLEQADRELHKAKNMEEVLNAQIWEKIVKKIRTLPENMVFTLKQQLAETPSGANDGMDVNFVHGTLKGAENG